MAITSITIENFKCIGDAVTIPIRPIALLFGKNSSGKSTILQALHYMREVCEHAAADADRTHMGGDYIDLGGFHSMVHLHDLDRKIRIRIEFNLTSRESEYLNSHWECVTNPDSAWIEVVTSWNAEEYKVYTESYGYGLNSIVWTRLNLTERPEARPSDTVGLNNVEWHRLGSTMLLNRKHPYIKDTIINDDPIKKRNLMILSKLREIALEELSNIRYLGPIRKLPPRNYNPQKTPNESLWAEGLEAWNTLGRNPDLVREINRYMRDVLKLGYSINRQEIISLDRNSEIMESLKKICSSDKLEADELKKHIRDLIEKYPEIRMKLHDDENDIDLDLIDVGLGISQVIPVLVGALHCDRSDPNKFYLSEPPGGFFAVEQPELHLHPAAQVALGDVFIDSIKYNRYHPVQVALKRLLDNINIENSDHFKEFFEIMRENSDHPDIQEEADRIIDNLKSSNYPDGQKSIDRFIEIMRENCDRPDIQSVIEKCLEKIINQDASKEFSYSIKNSKHRTMLIETHSEHLLLRLLRRVRETTEEEQTDHILTPDDLSIVYVIPTSEGVEFIPLNVMDNGDFDGPWPEGFFDERVKELL